MLDGHGLSYAACSASCLVASRKIPQILNIFPFAFMSWERKRPSWLWGFSVLSADGCLNYKQEEDWSHGVPLLNSSLIA